MCDMCIVWRIVWCVHVVCGGVLVMCVLVCMCVIYLVCVVYVCVFGVHGMYGVCVWCVCGVYICGSRYMCVVCICVWCWCVVCMYVYDVCVMHVL